MLLLILAVFLFEVPVKGSLLALVLGTLLYVGASTGFGQLVSTFTRTQVSAVFATIVIAEADYYALDVTLRASTIVSTDALGSSCLMSAS